MLSMESKENIKLEEVFSIYKLDIWVEGFTWIKIVTSIKFDD